MITDAQRRFYRAIWAEVCNAQGWAHLPGKAKDDKRRALHERLNLPASSTEFTSANLTAWDRKTRSLRQQQPRSAEDTQRTQALWRIRKDAKLAGFSKTYLNKIAFERFSTLLWEDLTGTDLVHFRNLIHARASKHLGHDTRTAPAQAVQTDDNEPF